MTGSLRFTQSLILVAGFMIDDYIGPLGAVAYFIINKKTTCSMNHWMNTVSDAFLVTITSN